MKKNELTALKSKSETELKAAVANLQKEWLTVNSNLSLRKEKNFHLRNKIRKNIARNLTILRQKEFQKLAEKKEISKPDAA